jgi:hypothetical protein
MTEQEHFINITEKWNKLSFQEKLFEAFHYAMYPNQTNKNVIEFTVMIFELLLDKLENKNNKEIEEFFQNK